MDHRLHRAQARLGRVLEQPADELDRLGRGAWAEHLRERVWLDLRELVLHVVRVHRLDLLARRRAEHLDDLDELVDARLSREEGLAQHQLGHHTPGGPYV